MEDDRKEDLSPLQTFSPDPEILRALKTPEVGVPEIEPEVRWACPECGSDNLEVFVLARARLIQTDDGDVEFDMFDVSERSLEWGEKSQMECGDCNHCDTAEWFSVRDQPTTANGPVSASLVEEAAPPAADPAVVPDGETTPAAASPAAPPVREEMQVAAIDQLGAPAEEGAPAKAPGPGAMPSAEEMAPAASTRPASAPSAEEAPVATTDPDSLPPADQTTQSASAVDLDQAKNEDTL